MGWIEGLNDAMDYIEANLEGDLDLAHAARLAACTEGQFRKMCIRDRLKVDAVGCKVLIVVALDQTGYAAADGSQTDQTDVHGAQGFAHR